jgi:hypothetical protein
MFRLMVFIALVVVGFYLYMSRGPGRSTTPASYSTQSQPQQNPRCSPPFSLIDDVCQMRDASGRPLDGSPSIMPPPPGSLPGRVM